MGPATREPLLRALRERNPSACDQELQREALTLQLAAAFGHVRDLPRTRRGGTARAVRDVDAAGKEAFKLVKRLNALHRDALAAFEAQDTRHPSLVADTLREFCVAASRAIGALESSSGPGPKGRRSAEQARTVTVAAKETFERLTGKPATLTANPYEDGKLQGEFLNFLEELFGIFRIQHSATSQARLLLYPPQLKK